MREGKGLANSRAADSRAGQKKGLPKTQTAPVQTHILPVCLSVYNTLDSTAQGTAYRMLVHKKKPVPMRA